jgi:hypothetical protein
MKDQMTFSNIYGFTFCIESPKLSICMRMYVRHHVRFIIMTEINVINLLQQFRA